MRPCPGDRAVHEAYDPRKLLKTARRPLSAIGLAMLLLVWLPRPAAATSCIGYSLGEHVGRASAVFQGRVVAIEGVPQDGSTVRFAVQRAWKGPSTSEIVLKHHPSFSMWWWFHPGQDYVVWAYAAADGSLQTSGCTPTSLVDPTIVEYLDRLEAHHSALEATLARTGAVAAGALVLGASLLAAHAVRSREAARMAPTLRPAHARFRLAGPKYTATVVRRLLWTAAVTIVLAVVCSAAAFALVGFQECYLGPAHPHPYGAVTPLPLC